MNWLRGLILSVLLATGVTVPVSSALAEDPVAFPGAEGFGADGLCVDDDGNLYCGIFEDGIIYKTAFDADGKPTKAAQGFARSRGVAVEDLQIIATKKGEYLMAVEEIKGQETGELLPDLLENLLRSIPFPKSMRWAERCRSRFDELKQAEPERGEALFGIVQGGVYDDLRVESLQGLSNIGFDGYAIGGLAVGEPEEERLAVLDGLLPAMPDGAPRYLMGVGTPVDIAEAVLFLASDRGGYITGNTIHVNGGMYM